MYRGTREEIRRMTDGEFKEIYGEEAERVGVGGGVGSQTGGGEPLVGQP